MWVPKNGRISVSTEIWLNPGEYREKVEPVHVLGKDRICASIEKLSGRVPENGRISVSTEKLSGRVQGKGRSV